MSNEFVCRMELDDLLNVQRKKIERLEQQAAEARESIATFRTWSIITASRLSQCETWILGLMPEEQRACVAGDEVQSPSERESARRDDGSHRQLTSTFHADVDAEHKWKVGDDETATPATPHSTTDNVVLKCGSLDDLLG